MVVFHHLGITIASLDRGYEQFDPIMSALGFKGGRNDTCAWWHREGETELLLYPAREVTEPHVHGRVGWQHLGLSARSRAEVEQLHQIALAAGWTEVRAPKPYPRFNPPGYYASFVESDEGIRVEFVHAPEDSVEP